MRRVLFLFVPVCIVFSLWSPKDVTSHITGIYQGFGTNKPIDTFTNMTSNCTACHKPYGVNDSVAISITGLPLNSNIQPGHTYTFSVNINNLTGVSNRARWGFAIRALNSAGVSVGTFTPSGNTQVGAFGALKHGPAIADFQIGSSYSYTGLQWTAPASPTGAVITFEAAGVAANNNDIPASGIGSTGDFVGVFVANAVLPVELKEFKAVANQNQVILNWNTASEKSFNRFSVERSSDGIHYASIASVPGRGTETSGAEYTTSDVPTVSGKYYYRLKMIDNDNSYKYSKVVTVAVNAVVDFNVVAYPNPNTNKNVSLQVSSKNSSIVKIVMVDMKGTVVYNGEYKIAAGQNTIAIPNNFSTGNYTIKVFSSNQFKQNIKYVLQ